MAEADAKKTAFLIAELAQSKHAEEIVIFQVSALTALAHYFVICSAETSPQMRAISEDVDRVFSAKGTQPLSVEGRDGGVWLLMDYSDVILHVFNKTSREFYGLDRLWGDAPKFILEQKALEADAIEGSEA